MIFLIHWPPLRPGRSVFIHILIGYKVTKFNGISLFISIDKLMFTLIIFYDLISSKTIGVIYKILQKIQYLYKLKGNVSNKKCGRRALFKRRQGLFVPRVLLVASNSRNRSNLRWLRAYSIVSNLTTCNNFLYFILSLM